MNALVLATRLSWVLDLISLAALAGTGEVRFEVFALAGAMFLLSRSGLLKVPEKVTLGALVALVLSMAGTWFSYRFHPIVGAAYLAPLVHSILFFAPETGRYRGWRNGIGFVELILASALAPDAYLFPAIFAFVLIAAVAVSSAFLDAELSQRAPEVRQEPLPVGFIRNSLKLAFLIFLSSIIIFPILPRMKMGGGLSDSFKVGYTEHVELAEKKGLNGREGTGEPVLRLYTKGGVDLSREIFLGLIRGRSLDIFDGTNWIANPRRAQSLGVRFVKPTELKEAIWVEADRSPLRTTSLPVPYGTLQVQNGYSLMDSPYPRTVGGEWIDAQGNDARVQFGFAFLPYQKHIRHTSLDEDPPLSSDLGVPEALKTIRMQRLGATLFSKAKNDTEKVERLMTFFKKEGFSASLSDSNADPSLEKGVQAIANERFLPMERFLFLTKQGHCEWFASSSVLLLRMAGVPARLVSGFRISKGPVGGVLTITTNDAHAWVEYWSPERGWTALDPTPRILGPSGILNIFRDGYEWVSAYWYRYVLNFTDSKGKDAGSSDFQSQPSFTPSSSPTFKSLRNKIEILTQKYRTEMVIGLGALLILSLAIYLIMRWRYPWIFSIRYRVREGTPALRRERMKMERLVLKRTSAQNIDQAIENLKVAKREKVSEVLKDWQETYHQLRFGIGSELPEPQLLKQLRRKYKSVKGQLNEPTA
jgi:transglutaminase-like putative cysteine protease